MGLKFLLLVLSSFLCNGAISASFSFSGKEQHNMALFTIRYNTGTQISKFCLRFLPGILLHALALLGFRFLIFNSTSSNVILLKANFDPEIFSFILRILGCYANFFRAISMGSVIPKVSIIMYGFSLILRLLGASEKKELSVSATSISADKI